MQLTRESATPQEGLLTIRDAGEYPILSFAEIATRRIRPKIGFVSHNEWQGLGIYFDNTEWWSQMQTALRQRGQSQLYRVPTSHGCTAMEWLCLGYKQPSEGGVAHM